MKQSPKVSILIPFYNCAYVNQAIESALDQTYRHKEIIVINDGSTHYAEKIKPYFPRIRYVKKSNGGTASALNEGIRHASGDYFSWLSADDRYDPFKVEKQLAFMQENKASVSYTSYYLIDENNVRISGSAGISIPNKIKFYETMKKGCIINGCTVMLDMNVFDRVGQFDESLAYTQDYDLWLRLLPHYDFHYLNEPLVHYRVHKEMTTKKEEKNIPQEINFVQKKHLPILNQLIAKESSV